MRILMIDHASSVMMYDHYLCSALSRRGCHITLLSSPYPGVEWTYRREYEYERYFYRWSNRILGDRYPAGLRKTVRGLEYLCDMRALVSSIDYWRPDIIHFQWFPLPVADAHFVKALRRRTRVVGTIHDTSARGEAPLQQVGLSQVLRELDQIVVLSEYSRNQIVRRYQGDNLPIAVVKHGVFTHYAEAAESTGGRDEGDGREVVLFFGVIKYYKGLDILLKAFAQLPREIRGRTVLHVAGRPFVSVSELKKLATRLGVSGDVRWNLGVVPEPQVAQLFRRCSVVVFPYREADQSGAMHIALAFGRPIVASRVGGFPDILQDRVHGYLVPPEDVGALAKSLEAVLGNPGRAKSMGLAVRRLTDQYCWERTASETMAVYETVLGRA